MQTQAADSTQMLLTRLMDVTVLRNKVLVNNLANADTPGYVRNDVSFEAELAEAARSGDLANFAPTVVTDHVTPARADGNNVSVDRELAAINENALVHQMAVQLMQTRFSLERMAISGRT